MPAIRQRSAGVIVFRIESGTAGLSSRRRFLLLDYGKHWDFPKGHLEKGEDDRTAALRELEEETGIRPDEVELLPGFAREIRYFFRDKRKGLIRKEVAFFLGQTDRKRVKLSHEHSGAEFLPLAEALGRVTYPTAKDVLRAAGEFLESFDREGDHERSMSS